MNINYRNYRKIKKEKEQPDYEEILAASLKAVKISGWTRQYEFCKARKWTSDFCWENERLLVEVEGGLRMNVRKKDGTIAKNTAGRHNSKEGFTKDCIKYNEAVILGWRLLRVTGDQVKSGQALIWIERALGLTE